MKSHQPKMPIPGSTEPATALPDLSRFRNTPNGKGINLEALTREELGDLIRSRKELVPQKRLRSNPKCMEPRSSSVISRDWGAILFNGKYKHLKKAAVLISSMAEILYKGINYRNRTMYEDMYRRLPEWAKWRTNWLGVENLTKRETFTKHKKRRPWNDRN